MSEWKECKLGDIAIITDCEHKTAPLVDSSEFISVRTSNIQNGKIDFNNSNRVSSEVYEEWTKRLKPNYGDIVLAREAPVGEVGWIPKGKNVCLGQRTVLIRTTDKSINPKYILYYLVNDEVKNDLINRSTGSVVEHLNVKDIKYFDLRIHDVLEEQIIIAEILSSLDDKIDLLHRQNATLETMAETLFRQWFVEEVKEEWEEKFITDLFEVRDGTHDSPKQKESGKRLITSKHLSSNKIDFDSAYFISEEDYTNVNKRSKVAKDDILFSMIGTIGIIYIEQSDKIDYAIKNIGLFKTSQNLTWKYFTFLWLKSKFGQEFIHEHRSGSTQEYISLGSLRSISFKVPNEVRIIEFNIIVQSYFQKLNHNQNQIRTLTTLRDTLLPKLMSGEVRVEV
jgi:type I restriction enzyme S subunit